MSEKNRRIAGLIFKHIEGNLEGPDKVELEAWLDESEHNSLKFHELTHSRKLVLQVEQLQEFEMDKEAAWLKLLERGLPEREPVRMFAWKKYVAIAAAVLVIAGGAWIWSRPKENSTIAVNNTTSKQLASNVAPGHDGAILTLAGGKTVVLDSEANGVLATQGNAKLVKLGNGRLAYNADRKTADNEVFYNELSTPRGRKFQLTLPDGSNVWLNAASSIRYPTSFTGKERKVAITGEAYFEVAKNVSMPFVVSINNTTRVQVLGTHFNIMAYHDENNITTTLLEGSVKVIKENVTALITPGQQARIDGSTGSPPDIKVIKDADTEAATAWKNGYFQFKKESIETIMRQLARWYDVDIQYEGEPVTERFYSKIPRSAYVSTVFKSLEATGSVHFKIDGKKIIVTR